MRRTLVILAVMGAVATPVVAGEGSRSADLAQQLTAALTQLKLDAVAAQDAREPDRFVAALFFPNAQLLVVSARYASPAVLQAKLAQKQYRDVYLDLQGAAVPKSSVFFQDMGADGLCAGAGQTADLMYSGNATPVVFDGDWKKHDLSEEEYERQRAAADERYGDMLQALLAQLHGT